MKILFDGGAFQQQISGGILNVAVNFLNAAVVTDPDLSFILLADPLFGEVRSEFLAKLVATPEIVYRPVLKRPVAAVNVLTLGRGLTVLVDGTPHPFAEIGDNIEIAGETAPRELQILSRTAQPSLTVEGSNDSRHLGVAFCWVQVEADGQRSTYYFDDPRFEAGNYVAEWGFRWTSGQLSIPRSMLPDRGPWRIVIATTHRIPYRLLNGQHDAALDGIMRDTHQLVYEHDLRTFANEMRELGVQAYFANHFLPIRLPGLGLFTWAYDIIPVVHPEFFNKDALENFSEVVSVLKAADAVFCISRFTYDSIRTHLSIDEDRLHISWIGVSPEIYRRSETDIVAFRQRYALLRPYLACVATIEPRKNHVALIEAYSILLKIMADPPDLVVAGMRGWGYDAFFQKVTALGLVERVRHLEHLDDNEVAELYSGAEMCVYPSLFEGFGLPVLEAMHCGIPVITSRNTSMEGIIEGGAGILVDPASPPAIAEAIRMVLSDPERRAALLAKANERLPLFDWSVIASSITRVMRGQR